MSKAFNVSIHKSPDLATAPIPLKRDLHSDQTQMHKMAKRLAQAGPYTLGNIHTRHDG